MKINETILLIIIAVTAAISALFCIIALATSNWLSTTLLSIGLFCSGCSTPSAGLSIVAFILLVIGTLVVFLFVCRVLPEAVRVIALIILFIASIFTLATFAAYFDGSAGYSYKLMVVSHFLSYLAAIMAAFWLGGVYATLVDRPT